MIIISQNIDSGFSLSQSNWFLIISFLFSGAAISLITYILNKKDKNKEKNEEKLQSENDSFIRENKIIINLIKEINNEKRRDNRFELYIILRNQIKESYFNHKTNNTINELFYKIRDCVIQDYKSNTEYLNWDSKMRSMCKNLEKFCEEL